MDYGRMPADDSLRITVENNDFFRRNHSPTSRNRFCHEEELRRREQQFSPHRDQAYARNRDDHFRERGWPAVQHDRREFEKRSPRRSPGRYSSWQRNSRERSPPRFRSRTPPRIHSRSPLPQFSEPVKGRNFFDRSRSRSLSPRRKKSRSRSRSRGRDRFRRSRSPRRKSPSHRSGRRSPSYGSRKRFKHRSSSSSSSGSRSRSSRRHKTSDSLNTVLAKKERDDSEPEDDDSAGYLHPVLNRGIKEDKPARQLPTTQHPTTVVTNSASNIASLTALSQAYGNSPPKQSYTQQDIDEEDRFLYGETLAQTKEEVKIVKPPVTAAVQQSPPESVEVPIEQDIKSKMTPGGFDSNALKNVLKAIGFNFEMSAQQSQTAATSSKVPERTLPLPQVVKTPTPVPQIVEEPQQIQTLQGGQVTRPRTVPQPIQQTAQQYYQPYDPYNQTTSVAYAPAPAAPIQPTLNTGLGYPLHVQDPTGGVLVYQPVSEATQQPQTLYQPQQQVPTAQSSGRVVLPPHRPDTPVKKQDDARQERLQYLQLELEKLKKQQNELLRKKRREKDGHKDPLIKKNNLLQAGVEEQIREIRQAAEKAAGIGSASESSENEDMEGKEEKFDYFDPGNHWCKLCDTISTDLVEFLTHLHSKSHRKAIDPYDRPWNDSEQSNKKKKADDCVTKALKGSEFLIPITGYFCTLCQTFSGDQICAEEHCKSYQHNAIFKKYCKKHPSYEKKYKKKKKAVIQAMENGHKNVKDKTIDTQVKYIEKPTKIKDEQKYLDKDSKHSDRVERVLKYIENDGTPDKNEQFSLKKEKKPKGIKREHSQSRYEEPVRHRSRESDRHSYEKSSFRDEVREEPKSYRPEVREERRSFKEEPREEKKLPRKYSDDYRERSTEHARHRKNRWSPGYDEYDRQQDDRYEVRHDRRRVEPARRNRRSRSRSPDEKWVEKSPQRIPKKIEPEVSNKPAVTTASTSKIPTPGFGKFSWGSGAKAESVRHFDQVPVDNPVLSHESHDNGNKNGDLAGKGKIAIKITGKSQIYPPRLSTSKSDSQDSDKAVQDKKALDLQKKVEALKKENALRAQLSSITLPAGRTARQFQSKPNTAAVILGTRAIGKNNNSHLSKNKDSTGVKDMAKKVSPAPRINMPQFFPARVTRAMAKQNEPPRPPETKISAIQPVAVEDKNEEPPPPGLAEPLPPGEDEISFNDADDGANSDASGISMEIASDED